MSTATIPVIAHGSCVLCLDCGAFSGAIGVCPACASHALYNVAAILDRTIESLEPGKAMVFDA